MSYRKYILYQLIDHFVFICLKIAAHIHRRKLYEAWKYIIEYFFNSKLVHNVSNQVHLPVIFNHLETLIDILRIDVELHH